jgi:hypothetical protein
MFNPLGIPETVKLRPAFPEGVPRCVTLDGRDDTVPGVTVRDGETEIVLPPKRIATVVFEKGGE